MPAREVFSPALPPSRPPTEKVPARKKKRASRYFLFGFSAAVLLLAGCKKESLSADEVHAITRELGQTASGAAPPGADVRAQFSRGAAGRGVPDHLYVTLAGGSSEAAHRAALVKLIQALDRVATRHGLTHEPVAGRAALVRFDYRRAGSATHSIHIVTPFQARAALVRPGSVPGEARLAIILDDMGHDRAAADAVFALAYPVTVSVLPGLPHSSEVAEEAVRRGYQVMLHLPMHSLDSEKAEPAEIRSGMARTDVASLLDRMLQSVPHALGVNNHQGSEATADAALMAELMPLLRERRLFFVDSRTTAASVAYDTARRLGVRCAFRSAPFLDDVPEAAAVRRRLALAVDDARKNGAALAIGHPHAATLEALEEMLPRLESQGVRLVFASELVK